MELLVQGPHLPELWIYPVYWLTAWWTVTELILPWRSDYQFNHDSQCIILKWKCARENANNDIQKSFVTDPESSVNVAWEKMECEANLMYENALNSSAPNNCIVWSLRLVKIYIFNGILHWPLWKKYLCRFKEYQNTRFFCKFTGVSISQTSNCLGNLRHIFQWMLRQFVVLNPETLVFMHPFTEIDLL